jgi:hypothetical protein
MFLGPAGAVDEHFLRVARTVPEPIELDVVAVASALSFQYVVDGRSLLALVGRRPWAAMVTGCEVEAESVLPAQYGHRITTQGAAAKELLHRLRREIEHAFAGIDRVTVLLSGGLDSRLSAAVLAGLAREGKVSDDIRAVTWGIPESRDRNFGARVARLLGMSWVPIELSPLNLITNVDVTALELGALLSPVHLHGVPAVCALDWSRRDSILVSTLGNGVGRGTYLWRHVSYARPLEPADWLGFLRGDVVKDAQAELVADLAAFRRRLGGRTRIAIHECEMLAHYVSGQLLPVYGLLARTAAPVHQCFSDPYTYRYLWSLSPLLRTGALYRIALRMCRPDVTAVPYALTNRPVRRLARSEPNGLSPFTHRYPQWIVHDLAESLDEALSRDWWDSTGVFDGTAIRRAWLAIRRHSEPHAHTAYVLLWLCSVRRLMEELTVAPRRNSGATGGAPRRCSAESSGPPWGFAGRPPGSQWRRLASLPRQGFDVVRCHLGGNSIPD